MKRILFMLFAAASLLTSCGEGEKMLVGNEIAPTDKNDIKAKNDSLIQAFISNDRSVFSAIGSKNFYDKLSAHTSNVTWAFRPRRYTTGEYTVYDELEIINGDRSKMQEYTSPDKGYTFHWSNKHPEMYVSMLKMPFIQQDYLMILRYIKEEKKWKVNQIELMPVGRFGLTPYDNLEKAKKTAKTKPLLAYFHANSAIEWMKDIEGTITYDLTDEAESVKKELGKELNKKYPFPKTIDQISTKPSVTDVSMTDVVEGMFPFITYESTITNDSIAVQREYEKVTRVLPKMYPDMDFSTRFVIYNVSYNAVDQYGNAYKKREQFIYKNE